ncbi:MAG: SsrA-binding protein SmpB [Phycisphaeraceae bacterium]|nr:MAG: SsrA-binding protein SmpB [Phycisphaeraceae bacterium]
MAKSGKHHKKSDTPTIENRRARHDYFISDTLEVGIRLVGTEVKAVRDGKASLKEGYVSVENGQLTLHNVNIGEYPPAGQLQHAMVRRRRLLAHRREIKRLARQVEQKGVTLVPLKLYFKDSWAKLLIGLGTGKAQHDKRQSIKERDMERDIRRAMSRRA